MATASHRYVGNLLVKGNADLNLESFDLQTDEGHESAISTLRLQALEAMDQRAIAVASLAITEDGHGVGSFEVENPKYALRP
jgi:hypothetical protein